jgi:CheY-like chemotaxis protein
MREPPLILVVDDVADNVDILQMRLESQGYEVATAADGLDALQKTRELLPDLLLLDIMMPKMDGLATVKRLKADASLPFIPVILVTAKSDGADVVAGLESGGDDYLTKPVDHAALSARVRAMLRIKALHDTVQAQARRLEEQAAEQDARGTSRGTGRRNRADRPPEAVSGAADCGDDRCFGWRGDSRKPPARHCCPVLRYARLYCARRNGRAGRRDGGSPRISLRARTADPSL